MPAVWTNPTTQPWASGHLVTAAELNTHLRDTLLSLGGAVGHIGAHVYKSGTQSINSATLTALSFDSERFDTDPSGSDIHSTVTNTPRLTVRTAGYYFVVGTIRYASNATGYRRAVLLLNDVTQLASVTLPAVNGDVTDLAVLLPGAYLFAVNDHVQLVAEQTSGTSINVEAGPYTAFGLFKA